MRQDSLRTQLARDFANGHKRYGLLREIDGQTFNVGIRPKDLEGKTDVEFQAFVDDLFAKQKAAFDKGDMERCFNLTNR